MQNENVDVIDKLNQIVKKSIKLENYEKALAALYVMCGIQYDYNQKYCDDDIENTIQKIGSILINKSILVDKESNFDCKSNIVFYDGFGKDTRGLATIFLKAIKSNGYHITYIADARLEKNQPVLHSIFKKDEITWQYIDMSHGYVKFAKELSQAIESSKAMFAFYYTTPDDVVADMVFGLLKGKLKRFQIDLTDHAFWIGKNAFDICIELRNVGSMIAKNYRGIEKEKLVTLPYYADINKQYSFCGWPFEISGKRVVFSGGALYKTLGDDNNTFYKIVQHILIYHSDIIFVYAGEGDDSELKILSNQFKNRVFHIEERKDLYQVMKHSILFLNTYPMFGGLMMHYAAEAGRLPITLKHNHDADGLLFNQENIGIEYENYDELIADVDKILNDDEYRRFKEDKLQNCVINEEQFSTNFGQILNGGMTQYKTDLNNIDTSEFRSEYRKRFNINESLEKYLVRKRNIVLFSEFPVFFIIHAVTKILKR